MSSPLGTIEESGLETLILQYEEEIKELRMKLNQVKTPSTVVQDQGYMQKVRRDLEEVCDLLALGDQEEAGKLWRTHGFLPIEHSPWSDVYFKLQHTSLTLLQSLETRLTSSDARLFHLSNDLKSTKRALLESENQCDLVKSALITSKRTADPAEVIVLRMQIKTLEDGIADRDRDIAELTTETELLKAEEQRLTLIVENLQLDSKNKENFRDSETINGDLLRKIQELTAENEIKTRKLQEKTYWEEIIDLQKREIEELKAKFSAAPAVSQSFSPLKLELDDLQSALVIEKNTRTQTTAQLQATIAGLESSHSSETLKLTQQLTNSEALAMQANLRIQEMQGKITDLMDKLHYKEQEMYQIEQEKENLERQIESISAEFERNCRENEQEKREKAELNAELREKNTEIEKMAAELEQNKSEMTQIREKMTQIRAKNAELETEIQSNQLNFDLKLSQQLSESSEIRKILESDKRLLEEKIAKIDFERSEFTEKIDNLKNQKEEIKLNSEMNRKKVEILEEETANLTAKIENLQRNSQIQVISLQNNTRKLEEKCGFLEEENRILKIKNKEIAEIERILEEEKREKEELEKEHFKCANLELRVKVEVEKVQNVCEKRISDLETELKDTKLRFGYALNLYRVRELEVVSLRAAQSGSKYLQKTKTSRRGSAPSLDTKDHEIATLQNRLKTQESTISELQKRIISLMTEETATKRPDFEENRRNIEEFIRNILEWIEKLPDYITETLNKQGLERLIETNVDERECYVCVSDLLTSILPVLTSSPSSFPPFHPKKSQELLSKFDQNSDFPDFSILFSLSLHNIELQKELISKSDQLISQNSFFKRNFEGKEQDLWVIQKWHESEKEILTLRNTILDLNQRFEHFYRAKIDFNAKNSENEALKNELFAQKADFENSQKKLKELEIRLQNFRFLENQKSTYEAVISNLREKTAKIDSEFDSFRADFQKGISDLKSELRDFSGENVVINEEKPDLVLSGVWNWFKTVRVGLNQRISELERRLEGILVEKDRENREKMQVIRGREAVKEENLRIKAEMKAGKMKLEEANAEIKALKKRITEENEQKAENRLIDEFEAVKNELQTAQKRIKSLETENNLLNSDLKSLKTRKNSESVDLIRDLQTKSELIERLVGDNENTKQHYHRKELALLELLSEKEEALHRMEAVQMTTMSVSFRRRKEGEEDRIRDYGG